MTLRDRLLKTVDNARKIAGSTELDQRPTQLTVRVRTWAGGRKGALPFSDSDLVLAQHFTVKALSAGQAEQIVGSGGNYTPGQVVKVVVTPQYAGGGYTFEQLAPDESTGTEVLYLLSSNGKPSGMNGTYKRCGVHSDRPYRYELFLQRSNQT